MTTWPAWPARLQRVDLLRVDSLIILARNVRAALDSKGEERPQDALSALDYLVKLADEIRPAIEARVTAQRAYAAELGGGVEHG